jgi:hypothetical protein
MPDIATTVDRYIAAWNEPDPDRRRALVGAVWTDEGTYLDPLAQGAGPDAITDMIGGLQAQFPGHTFALVAAPDHHHDRVRFTWRLETPAGDGVLATGYDYATVAADGRLREVTGFLEMAA